MLGAKVVLIFNFSKFFGNFNSFFGRGVTTARRRRSQGGWLFVDVEGEGGGREVGGVGADVVEGVVEVFGVADDAVVVVFLPDGAVGFGGFVYLVGGEAFYGVDDGVELVIVWLYEQVYVVGHYDVGDQPVELAVEVVKAVGNDLSQAGVLEDTFAVAVVEELVNTGCDELGIFASVGGAERQWV